MRLHGLLALLLGCAGSAGAASNEVEYGPAPAWIVAPPNPAQAMSTAGGPARLVYGDWQVHLEGAADESYTTYRIKILTPQGLSAGNVTATWNPSSDDITIHALKIIRDSQVIDVLATTRFHVIERENNLDYAMLDGQLTATLQAPGLQVGDEIVFAATVRHRDPTFADRSFGLIQLPLIASPEVVRARLSWPQGKPVQWQATPDLGPPADNSRDGRRDLTYQMLDPPSAIIADGAPPRVNVRRLVEYSSFSSWGEVANVQAPIYDKAAALASDSPIRLEAAKIAKATNDPVARAEAALRLVQDRIRYVYVGLDGGNYRPANADDTWSRRFGDCKAKTVLLIALLRELGIPGEAVLVNSRGGDGTDQRLPTPQIFDHVLVRAAIGSKSYWLDGTRTGDRRLANLPAPTFRWALPLRTGSVALEAVPPRPLTMPDLFESVSVDSTAGFDKPAKVEASKTMRGDLAIQFQLQLTNMAHDDIERAERAYWREEMSWVEPDTMAWRYDEDANVLVLNMAGVGQPAWDGDGQNGRGLNIYGAGFTPPNKLTRPKEQDQTAPWLTDFPSYRCWSTTIKLPAAGLKRRWDYSAAPVSERLGGIAYWRVAELRDDVMHTVMSKKTYLRKSPPCRQAS